MGFFSDKTKDKIDKKVTKIENKGFNFANKMHRYAISGCLIFIGYELFQFLKEYNNFFLNARKIKKMEEFDPDSPINRNIDSE